MMQVAPVVRSKPDIIKTLPLLALLLACALHIVVILSIKQVLSEIRKINKTIPITLIKLPLPVKEKPVSVVVSSPVVPIATTNNLVTVEQGLTATINPQPVLSKVKPLKKQNWQHKPAHPHVIAPVEPVNVPVESTQFAAPDKVVTPETPVKPTASETVVVETAKPVPNEAVTLVESVPVIPELPQEQKTETTPAVEPVITQPLVETKPVAPVQAPIAKPIAQEVTEPVIKTTAKPVSRHSKKTAPDPIEATPQLSLDDLSSQIAQVSEKIVNQQPKAMENRVKTAKSIRSHQYLVNQYIKDWEQKVERIGNFNYPQAARQKDFAAKLTLEVGINADGSIHSMQIKKSSGDAEIDQAAKNIVQMSAPFSPLPSALVEELDVLMIHRVWQFADELGIR
jgi:protein TonB